MNIQISEYFTYRKLIRFVLPSVIMMIFTSIYGVIDGYFVSNVAGKTAFAAVNLVMPFVMILGGMGFMIGTGGTALVSKTLGEGNKEKANQYFSMMIIFAVLLGIVLIIAGIVFIRPVAVLFGASEAMMEDCVSYGRTVISFTCAFMLQNIFQTFLVAAEKPKFGLYTTIAAGVTNIVLDALFISVFRWGVTGAALATGISQFIGGIIPLIYFLRPNSSRLRLVKTKLSFRPILQACINGSSELMSNVSVSLVSVVYNLQLMKYIGENGVSAYGVLMYVQFIFNAVFMGFTIGSAPIIGFNYGSGDTDRLKNMLKMGVKMMLITGVILTIIAMLLSVPLASLFVGYDKELYELTLHAFRLFAFSFLLAGYNVFCSGFFTALNNGGVSACISFLRTLVFQLLSVLFLPIIFDTEGIWYAITIAEICAFIISTIFLFAKKNKYHYM
ncbi:MAG TPA: MATE family efflux transporter [Ruminococcus sp.]|nr:MATE family efflux transporter [Ruminococcus sp.]